MHLCDNGHDEVCYDGFECPVCKAIREIQENEDTMDSLRTEIDDLRAEIDELSG